VVVQLPDGPLLLAREAVLDRPQHRERHGADGVITGERDGVGSHATAQRHRGVVLLDGAHLGTEADNVLQFPVEGVRQRVHATRDRAHVDVRAAELLAQHFDERVVQVALDEVHDRVELDCAFAEPARAEEFVERVLVVLADDLRPGILATGIDHLLDLGDGLLPQRVSRATVLRR
jgi:hypothetical protein